MPSSNPGTWEVIFQSISEPMNSRATAIHAILLHTKKILFFHMRYFPALSAYYDFLSPFNLTVTEKVPPIDYMDEFILPALFCGGHIALDDGRIIVAGGEVQSPPDNNAGLKYVYIYDPEEEPGSRWIDTEHDMTHGRWYPTLTGWVDPTDDKFKVIAMSGFTEEGTPNFNLIPGIYSPGVGWTDLTDEDAEMPLGKFYPGAHVIPYGSNAGKIFYSMPMVQAYTFDPLGNDDIYWETYASERSDERYFGNSVLLPILPNQTNAKVVIIGGNAGSGPAYDTAQVIDLNTGSPTWAALNNMNYSRINQFAILLPDQTLLVVGGNSDENTVNPVFNAELLDVSDQANITTVEWAVMSSATVARNYHSTALLLPDASVLCMGGRLTSIDGINDTPYANDFESDMERRFEVYKPGYFYEGDRPIIDTYPEPSTDPIPYNDTFEITLQEPPFGHDPWLVSSIVLIRPGACTHGLDMEQRMIVLDFTENSGIYTVSSPANYNIALPGYYMLFVVLDMTQSNSGKSNIPSEAVFINLTLS